MSQETIHVTAESSHPRIDHFLASALEDMSRSQLEKLFKSHRIKLNGAVIRKRSTAVKTGDRIEIEPADETRVPPSSDTSFHILYEDDYILIINKPPGIAVHPGAGKREETILDILLRHCPPVGKIPGTDRPGIVHRLDKETSGILLLAKDERTMKGLQKKFKRREVQKSYLALVKGSVRFENGSIDEPIIRHPRYRKRFMVPSEENDRARDALTRYSVLERFEDATYLEVVPHTGRTHQIRVHLAFLGNPVLGDRIYGDEKNFPRLALHARRLRFFHPVSGDMIERDAPIPSVFTDYLETRRNR